MIIIWEVFNLCVKEVNEPRLSFKLSVYSGWPNNISPGLDLFNSKKLWDVQNVLTEPSYGSAIFLIPR